MDYQVIKMEKKAGQEQAWQVFILADAVDDKGQPCKIRQPRGMMSKAQADDNALNAKKVSDLIAADSAV